MGGKQKKDVKQRLRAVTGGRPWCQLCYGWQTLKCLIHSGWRAGKHAATYCGDQTLVFESQDKVHVVAIFMLK